jgi:hypothetical protein
MNTRSKRLVFTWLLLIAGILVAVSACAPAATPQTVERVVVAATSAPLKAGAENRDKVQPAAQATAAPMATPAPGQTTSGKSSTAGVRYSNVERLIIKNAELDMTVEDTSTAVDLVTAIAVEYGGYLVGSHSWYTNNRKEATISLGVPVDQFENVLRRLRGLALRVEKEISSGQDVTDQYVDLNSRIRNLDATAERIRGFLKAATTITEALKINDELTRIEEQIETLKGKVNYLADRSAYSTITVQLHEIIPTPTPTTTGTPTATPTPVGWKPAEEFEQASGVLRDILQTLGTAGIWAGTVCLPFALPLGLIAWFVYSKTRKPKKTPQPPAAPTDNGQQP